MAIDTTILPSSDTGQTGASWGDIVWWSLVDEAVANDSDYVQAGAAGKFRCACTDMPAGLSVLSVTVLHRTKFAGAASDQQVRPYLYIGGAQYSGSWVNVTSGYTSFTDSSYTWTTNPATSAPWTPAQINALEIGWEYDTAGGETCQVSQLKATVSYVPTPPSVDVTRHIGSVALWLRRRPEAFLAFDGNLDLLNLDLLDHADIEHTAGPHATETGWEDEAWQRRPFALHEMSIDLNSMMVSAKFKDQRPIRMLVRDLAWSDKASGSLGDGIARFLTPGALAVFTRPAAETFTNPVGESETVPVDTQGYADGGLQMLAGSSSRYYYTNNIDERTLSAAQGTFQCEVKFLGTLAEDRVIAYCYHDASNYLKLYYDNASGKIKFSMRVAGTTTTVTALAAASNATWYQVGIYWTGWNLENSTTQPTIALYIDRVLQASSAMGGSSADLVVNGGFESSSGFDFVSGWTDESTGTATGANADDGGHGGPGARTGAYSGRLAGTLGASGVAIAMQDLVAVGGRSLIVSAYCITGSASVYGYVYLQNLTTGNYYNGTTNAWESSPAYIGRTNATGAYTLITETLTIEGTGSVTLRLTLQVPLSASGAANFDDVSAVIDLGGGSMTEAASSNFDIGSEAGSNLLRGQVRKIHSYQHVLTPTEMQRSL